MNKFWLILCKSCKFAQRLNENFSFICDPIIQNPVLNSNWKQRSFEMFGCLFSRLLTCYWFWWVFNFRWTGCRCWRFSWGRHHDAHVWRRVVIKFCCLALGTIYTQSNIRVNLFLIIIYSNRILLKLRRYYVEKWRKLDLRKHSLQHSVLQSISILQSIRHLSSSNSFLVLQSTFSSRADKVRIKTSKLLVSKNILKKI